MTATSWARSTQFGTVGVLFAAAAVVSAGCGASNDVTAVGSRRSQLTPTVITMPFVDAPVIGPTLGSLDVVPVAPVPAPPDVLVDSSVPRPTKVAVVGDSLTVSATDELEAALGGAGFDTIDIDGLESRRMARGGSDLPPGVEAVAGISVRSEPELWVIALGTNDVASVGNLSGFRSEMRSILDLLPPDVPVIWVDLWIRDRTDSIVEANGLIRAELRSWTGGATVVDWYAHGLDEGVIAGDGVHLTSVGQQLFADSIVAAVDEMFAPTS